MYGGRASLRVLRGVCGVCSVGDIRHPVISTTPSPVTLKIVSASGYPRYSGPRAEGSKIVIIVVDLDRCLVFLVHLLAIT
jgi:hypothetical protein